MSNRKGAGKQVNRTELAEFFGVAMPTVDHWVRTGCPVEQRGSKGIAWVFNTADVAQWREQKARSETAGTVLADEAEIKRRRAEVGLERDQLELARVKGEVAPVDQFQRALSGVLAEVRAGLRIIPDRVPRLIVGETDEARIKSILRSEIDTALEALANADLLADDDLGETDDDDAE